MKMNDGAVRLPSVYKWLEFGNHCNKERIPFITSTLEVCSTESDMESDKEDASTYQQHEVFSIGYTTCMTTMYDDVLSSVPS